MVLPCWRVGRVRVCAPGASAAAFALASTGPLSRGPAWRTHAPAGMAVTNVFKLEHEHLLRRFQKASSRASDAGTGKVKGLFCALPPKCLPRLAAFGA